MVTTVNAEHLQAATATTVSPDSFEPGRHFYPRVLNAQMHPVVAFFLRMSRDRLVARYCHLHPQVDADVLHGLLATKTEVLYWAGADLFYTVTETGVRRMIVVETNSCPSGMKSMPLYSEDNEQGGYRTLLERAFIPRVKSRHGKGRLGVIWDKNEIEAAGYAAALADLTGEDVLFAPCADGAEDSPVRFTDRVLEIRDDSGTWQEVRAAFRYVTQKPWNRIPVSTKTLIFNPVLGGLAGGRNKLVASKAYELLNAQLRGSGLAIRTPETIRDVSLEEVPLWIERFGGHAVVKNPYSNAGQGVWTITNDTDLKRFNEASQSYERFIVQALVGNSSWSSEHEGSRYYHVGTVPNRRQEIYATDLRVMVASGPEGFFPASIYSRRAPSPLARSIEEGAESWPMLGTNLSARLDDGGWSSDTDRLLLMDRKDFNLLGLGPDDLLEAYVQTVLSVIAIDRLGKQLLTTRGGLNAKLFKSLNDDAVLLGELCH